jgi:hypothetical protein
MSADRLRELTAAAWDLAGVALRVRRTLSPIVEVALVPVPDAVGPIVEVEIIPVTELRRLQQLKTLAEIRAVPLSRESLQKRYTKLDRAIAKKAARLDDATKLRKWATAVKERDQWTDRKTGKRVKSTRQLDPLRAEAHHIISKDDWAVRYDIRNGICLSFETHFLVEHHKLRIEGTVFFKKHGATYINGRYPVTFVRL